MRHPGLIREDRTAGRRNADLLPSEPCPHCGSTQFDWLAATDVLVEFRCHNCLQTWITLVPPGLHPEQL